MWKYHVKMLYEIIFFSFRFLKINFEKIWKLDFVFL